MVYTLKGASCFFCFFKYFSPLVVLSFVISCAADAVKSAAVICNISVSVLKQTFIISTYVLLHYKIHLIHSPQPKV